MKYQTQSVILRGALCGPIWWPVGQVCGMPVKDDMEKRNARFVESDGSASSFEFRPLLNSLLCDKGGDFQGAEFTADTEIEITRVCRTETGIKTHSRTIMVASIAPDMVNHDHYTGDFC